MSSRWSVVFSFASLLTKSVPRPVRVAGEQDGSAPEGEAVRQVGESPSDLANRTFRGLLSVPELLGVENLLPISLENA